MRRRFSLVLIPLYVLWCESLWAQVPAPDATGDPDVRARASDFFEQHVRPLLAQHCYECHSRDADPPEGGLQLDSRAGWQRGGDLGPAIVPGKPDESLLIEAVEQRGDRLRMPPDGRLSDGEIAVLRQWITQGAIDPRTDTAPAEVRAALNIDEGRDFWAFQPLQVSEPDRRTIDRADWAANTLDLWILQQWQAQGLHPVPLADRRTLIRRATLDLTGLPPTPEEIEAFVNDPTPDAYARLIERLLASPRYGERWGRFWLDVARYADSNGLDENIAHGNAWRYRDYVIASFNRDQPYSTFVVEQLAGDLLPAANDPEQRNSQRIATGFLSLGPKVLAEVDEKKMELDIIDEQVETVGRAFLALTLGCARCHDHKFDPISTRDYYGLAGIFKSTRTMEHFTKIARWNEVSLATPAEQAAHDHAQALLKQQQEKLQQLNKQSEQLAQQAAALPELPSAMAVADYEQPVDLPIHIRGSHLTLGEVVPRQVPAVLTSADHPAPPLPANASGRKELAEWLVDGRQPLTARVMVNRIWRWHFGRGLVPSTDNFGNLGAQPIHPRLLDWLANRFVQDGWSIKQLHRLIMLSSTYQLDSQTDDANLSLDPENRYQWRAELRRLEAEAIRDAMLAVSNSLDLKMGGSLLHVKNREFLFDHTSKDETRYDAAVRSVYLPVIRNHLYDMFQLFDHADESVMTSDRATTTVAPQALFMLNSPLAQQAAWQFAQRLLAQHASPVDRHAYGYQLAFGREPTAAERARDFAYLDRFRQRLPSDTADDETRCWALLCHTWLSSSEFIYVR